MRDKIVRICRNILKNMVYTSQHGLAKGLRRKGGLGFLPEIIVSLSEEEKFLKNLNLIGKVVYDVGGYEGVFSLFFASAVDAEGKVITFEPSDLNYKRIKENIELNNIKNIEVKNIGLGRSYGKHLLSFCSAESGKGSIAKNIREKILSKGNANTIEVEVHSLDDYITKELLLKPDFVKIDVEGMELDVIEGMQNVIEEYRPQFFIELHGISMEDKVKNTRQVIDFLLNKNYSIWHVEKSMMINKFNSDLPIIGHLYCKEQ